MSTIESKIFKRQASITYLKGRYVGDKDSELDILLFYINNSYKVVNFVFDVKSETVLFPEFLESIIEDIIEIHTDIINDIKNYNMKYLTEDIKIEITGDYNKELSDARYLLLSEETVNEFLDKKEKIEQFVRADGYQYKLIKNEIGSISSNKMTRGIKNYETHPAMLDLSEYKDFEISELEEYIVKSTLDGKEHYTLLTGDPGTGKSTIAKVVAYREEIPVYQMQFSNGTDEEGALCGVIPNTEDPKGTPWLRKESVLLFAMRHGGLVILDEINKAPTSMTSVLNSILDDNASYTTDTGEVVKLHKDFRIIATMNPKVENMVNDSTVNRFRVFRIEPLSEEQLKSRLYTKIPELDNNEEMVDMLVKHYKKINNELHAKGKIENTPRNLLGLAQNILELQTLGYEISQEMLENLYKANLIDWLDVNYVADVSEYVSLYSLVSTLSKELHSKIIIQEVKDKDLGISININVHKDADLEMLQNFEDQIRKRLEEDSK